MRVSFGLVLVLLFSAGAAVAQLEHGSVLIVAYSPNEIVMAADSRVTNVQTGQFRDNYCKLAVPGGKILFGGTGLVESIGGFDSVGLVRRIVSQMNPTGGDGFVQQVATRWANAMEQNYAKLPSNLVSEFIRENGGARALDCTMFAGAEPGGGLSLIRARVYYRGSPGGAPSLQGKIEIIPLQSPQPNFLSFAGCGNIDILQSLLPPKTDWARSTVEQWKHSTGDIESQAAIQVVQLTIAHEKPQSYGGKQVVLVGGPVDAAEVRQNGSVRWLQRKPDCAAN
ncbi:MAG: hypothetical protein ACRD3D_15820 [Terriglobia bacterium]